MATATLDTQARLPPRAQPSRSSPLNGIASDGSEVVEEGPRLFEFTGSGGEYFRIWIVNLLLTIVTFGVYSAWAKVRRLQYFHRNTRLAGAVFDYRGNPKAILRGRALALVMLVGFKIASAVSMPAAVVILLLMGAILPWLLARAIRFKLRCTSYRGIAFDFSGSVAQAYRTLIMFPIVLGVTGFFLWSVLTSFARQPSVSVLLISGLLPLLMLAGMIPLAHYLLKRFQHDNASFGQTPFFFYARMPQFYKMYACAFGLLLLGGIPAGIFAKLTGNALHALQNTAFGWLVALLYSVVSAYAFYLFVRPYLESRLQNVVWNQTELGEHRFASNARARHLLWIHASNLLLLTLSCGLYKPFAAVRLARYRINAMTLVAAGALGGMLAGAAISDDSGALGQESGDLFNLDIGL
jgi:uncharacterized membrane protein YjgN (DUF898 family)